MSGLTEGAKSAVSGLMEKGLAELQTLVNKVLALPGVDDVLKPALSELMNKLTAVAGKKK